MVDTDQAPCAFCYILSGHQAATIVAADSLTVALLDLRQFHPGHVLAIVLRPRGGDWLDAETRAWRAAGIDLVVSLLEPSEETEFALDNEGASASANELEFRSFSIPDRGVPKSREAVSELATQLVTALRAGKYVALHCRQSVGRSALIAAAVLISAGEDEQAALANIARARGLPVPETDSQRRWISEFASYTCRDVF